MRLIFLGFVFFFILNHSYSQLSNSNTAPDTTKRHHISRDSLICINYRMLPDLAKYANRYKILNSANLDYRRIDINYSLQNFLKTENYSDLSLVNSFSLVKENMVQGKDLYSELTPYRPFTEKDLFYGVWRNQITKSSSEGEIRQSIINGTSTLIDLGYTDIGNDFLPFITVLMEEEHILHYDTKRTKISGKGSKGIVTAVEIMNALGSQDPKIKFGVCRDIHEAGRLLLKPMCEVYFNNFYPGRKIDFDDYIFLQSWTTDASQHVVLSLINPLNTKVVYELDWGRVIEKTNITGYNNGRLYGNTFRIWQYNKEKQMSMPVDFKRTEFGKILDEDILTPDEYLQFNGIYDEEYYSNIRYIKSLGENRNINFSIGAYYPDQKYFLTSYLIHTKKKKVAGFLNHSSTIAFQAAIHEDTRKKQLLYPQTAWQITTSIMVVPRIISKFETKKFKIARNVTFDAYLNQQLDAFVIQNAFHTNDSIDTNIFSHSGDGNLSFSNGFNIDYCSENKSFISSFTIQGRSCLLPGDIRLLSPNPVSIFSNIRFITPAIDAISKNVIKLNEKSSLSINAMVEFTNKDAMIFSGSVSAKIGVSKNMYLVTSVGKNDQIKGIPYFWYPVSRSWIDFQFNYLSNVLSFSLLKVPESQLTLNITFRKYLK